MGEREKRTAVDDAKQWLEVYDQLNGDGIKVPRQLVERLIAHIEAVERRNQILAGRVRELEGEAARRGA